MRGSTSALHRSRARRPTTTRSGRSGSPGCSCHCSCRRCSVSARSARAWSTGCAAGTGCVQTVAAVVGMTLAVTVVDAAVRRSRARDPAPLPAHAAGLGRLGDRPAARLCRGHCHDAARHRRHRRAGPTAAAQLVDPRRRARRGAGHRRLVRLPLRRRAGVQQVPLAAAGPSAHRAAWTWPARTTSRSATSWSRTRAVVRRRRTPTSQGSARAGGWSSTTRLISQDTPAEIRVLTAHELGHAKYDDVLHGTIEGALAVAAAMCALFLSARRDGRATRARSRSSSRLYAVVGFAVTPLTNLVSRHIEARADAHSLQLTHDPQTFIAAQKKLAIAGLDDLEPSPCSTRCSSATRRRPNGSRWPATTPASTRRLDGGFVSARPGPRRETARPARKGRRPRHRRQARAATSPAGATTRRARPARRPPA